MPPFEVATVGDNCIDRFLPPVGLTAVGGNAVNVAVHLRRLGLATAYFGAVGRDADGARMLACFRDNGLVTDHVRVTDAVTAYTDVATGPDGDRSFVFEEYGACRGYRPCEAEIALLLRMRHVHIGWLDDGGALKRRLVAAGVSVSQDLAVNPGAEGLAVAFASAGDRREAAHRMARDILAQGARLAVVTRGAHGSLATDGRETIETGVTPVAVADTTGAGDTFIAGFLAAHLAGASLAAALEAGRDAAAETCGHFGGFPQVPLPLSRD